MRHPAGLYICFGTELWERFSYYGMRALLIFYLTQHLLFTDSESYAIYGAYTSIVWGLPVVGGIVADRYLGSRKAVVLGGVLMSLGHLLLAVEGPAAIAAADGTQVHRDGTYLSLFFLSLALIATGVGFLKTNISTVVGALYDHDDPRRERGFTIFYLGINLGGAIAPLFCGWLGQTYGWSYGFGLAGIGMLGGLALFLWGQRFLEGHAEPPQPMRLKEPVFLGINVEMVNYIGALALVALCWLLMQNHHLVGGVLSGFSTILAIIILYFSFFRCTAVERDRMLVVCALILVSILFWSLYEQIGSSLNLFADRLVDRNVLGYEVNASQLQALPATFVLLLAPIFTMIWKFLEDRSMNPDIPRKFALGMLFIGMAFVMPIIGSMIAENGHKIGLVWFILVFMLMVCGELCMAPIAMNMVTRLCPKRVVGMMMGMYFLSLSLGSFVAAKLAAWTSFDKGGEHADLTGAIGVYVSSFKFFALIGVCTAAFVLAFSSLLHRRMHVDRAD